MQEGGQMKAPKALYLFGKKPIDNKTVYLKSEADRYIAHQKMKRCEAMARWCEATMYNIRRKPLCDMDGHEVLHSSYDDSFEYRLGQEIEIKDFDLMYNVECASGFHFFRTRKEAEEYK